MPDLLRVEQALDHILAQAAPLPAESIPLAQGLGRVLAQDITADTSLPPFASSSMDGYAVRAADVAAVPARLRVVMDILAGTAPGGSIGPGEAARIMTGAPLPPGADAVVPVEDTDTGWTQASAAPLPPDVGIARSVPPGASVRQPGEDVRVGQVVLRGGHRLRPQDLGMLAALGWAQVPAVRRPRVAVVSTGDELLPVDAPLRPGAIRDSNSYMVAALVESWGGEALRLPVARDTLESVRAVFAQALDAQPDVIISTAGVSVGAADVVRAVLEELGEVSLWRVNLRPGKPLAFGHLRGVPFFGLPGNPVSAAVTFEVFVRPFLLAQQCRADTAVTATAITAEDLHSDGRRSYLRVTLTRDGSQLVARTTGTQSSGALMSLLLADGLLIVPEDVTFVPAGSVLDVRLFSSIETLPLNELGNTP
jgi:molybdopterin molybdotransferase